MIECSCIYLVGAWYVEKSLMNQYPYFISNNNLTSMLYFESLSSLSCIHNVCIQDSKMCDCFWSRQYLEEEFVLRVMNQLTLALKECHRRSDGGHTVLHRDLKPANVFLDSKHNVKLGDFGLARILNHDSSFAKTFVGTPYYMSPVSISEFRDFLIS